MRSTRLLPTVLLAIALAAPASAASADGGAPYVSGAQGGVRYGAPVRPVDARPIPALLQVAPRRVRTGRMPLVRFRIVQRGARAVAVRVAVVRVGSREASVDVRLGQRTVGSLHTVRWPQRTSLAPGRYVVRLHAVDAAGHTLARSRGRTGKAALRVQPRPKPKPVAVPAPAPVAPAPPSIDPAGTFPVAGPHGYGGEDARFGAGRRGHVHQGQDVLAAEGTPVVAPTAGTVIAVDDQPSAAGWYVTMHSIDGRDFFFAHCQKGSIGVAVGAAVAPGTPLCRVGHTGDATGPHLHFEIWVGGWGHGHPVDPLPQLQAWDH